MREQSPVNVANHICMKRSATKKVIVIVEGYDDRQYFNQFLNLEKCSILEANGKSKVIEVMNIINYERSIDGVLGIVDADYDNLEKRQQNQHNVIKTDIHDLDCILVRSSAFESVLKEYSKKRKIEVVQAVEVRRKLLEIALPIGIIRRHSAIKSLRLKFKNLNFKRIIDDDRMGIDINILVNEIKNKSNRLDISTEYLVGLIDVDELEYDDPWQICNGSDLIAGFSYVMKNWYGNKNAKDVDNDKIRIALRLASDKSEFNESFIGKSIINWCDQCSIPNIVLS